MKVIISGGGTGGHIFPALSIAGALKEAMPDVDILFVGAEGKMEMERVPAAGYKIVGLPVAGLQRRFALSNFVLPFKVLSSLRKASVIIKEFKPNVVVGVGGYASAPVLWTASRKGIPTLIQEQNSYAGLTNKILGKRAKCICTAYEGMDKFFPADKIILTGNPIRKDLFNLDSLRNDAIEYFGINPALKTVLFVGGSLGARTINESVELGLSKLGNKINVIWQTGKGYFSKASEAAAGKRNIKLFDFVSRMDYALAAADVIVSRAGAGTISELCIVGKPVILVPSPNVSEDHQTQNAKTLANKGAAILIADSDAQNALINSVNELMSNKEKREALSAEILKLAKPDAAEVIAKKVIELANTK